MFRAGILTISDKGAAGERVDRSSTAIRDMLSPLGCEVSEYEVVPDEKEIIASELAEWSEEGNVDVIFTTGGTGLSERDITPEATLAVIERNVPGIAEAMRIRTLDRTPMAMLSRAVAGVKGKCLIINLPGSPKAVQEYLEVVLPAVQHAVDIIKGEVTEHAESGGEHTE
jgi:molybdenum cofactor synthesis domain-containing protein